MARIRTIKPEFWGDEKLAPLSAIDRLVFLGLISMADDAGRLVDSIKSIDGFVFPETSESARESLATLTQLGRIIRYRSDSGQPIIQIANWLKHQRVDKASKYVLPPQPRRRRETVAEFSRDIRGNVEESSRSDLGPTTLDPDLRPPTVEQRAAPKSEEIDRVLAHYLALYPRRRIGPKDRKAAFHALKLGYSPDDLCEAIDGNASDPWHREKGKHELPYVLRDTGKIDDFRAKLEASRPKPVVDPDTGLLNDDGVKLLSRGGNGWRPQ